MRGASLRSLSTVKTDDHVQVRWKNNIWYDCDAIETDDDDSPTTICIRWPVAQLGTEVRRVGR